MAPWRRAALLSSAVVGVMTLASPISEAHGRGPRGPRGTVVVGGFRGGFYAPAFGFGVGYAPYWGPWGWGWADGPALPPPGGGIDLGAALVAGYGAVEMNAKPGERPKGAKERKAAKPEPATFSF